MKVKQVIHQQYREEHLASVCVCVLSQTCNSAITRKYKLTIFLNCSQRNLKMKLHRVYLPVLQDKQEVEKEGGGKHNKLPQVKA